jgi:hypothetical protein
MSQNLATAMPTGSDKFGGGDGLARESTIWQKADSKKRLFQEWDRGKSKRQ